MFAPCIRSWRNTTQDPWKQKWCKRTQIVIDLIKKIFFRLIGLLSVHLIQTKAELEQKNRELQEELETAQTLNAKLIAQVFHGAVNQPV